MEANNTSTTQEGTTSASVEEMEFRIVKISLYVLILALSCAGNSLVAIVIIGAKDMRTPANFLILHLALCDFITPALSIPFDLALEERDYVWQFGKTMCKLLWPLETAFSISSSVTLAVISLERFRTLSKPFVRRLTSYHVLMAVLSIQAISIGICVPYFLVLNYTDEPKRSCDEIWPNVDYRKGYTVALFLFGYAFPLMTMSVAYLLIYRNLRLNLLRLTSVDERRHGSYSKASQLSNMSKDSMEHRRKEQNIHLAKMFIIVVVVFAISMFPNQVIWFWNDFENGGKSDYFNYVSAVGRICTYANSVLNPFIYALKSKEFRSGFARIGHTTVVKPLRKISSETRKFARKVSRSVPDNQRPSPPPEETNSRGNLKSVRVCSDQTWNGKRTNLYDSDFADGKRMDAQDFIMDLPLQEGLINSSNLGKLLEELKETDC